MVSGLAAGGRGGRELERAATATRQGTRRIPPCALQIQPLNASYRATTAAWNDLLIFIGIIVWRPIVIFIMINVAIWVITVHCIELIQF